MTKFKDNEYKVINTKGSVIASCKKTRAKCPLIPQFAQRPGHLISQTEYNDGVYECTIMLRIAPELKQQAVVDLRETVSALCKLCKASKTR